MKLVDIDKLIEWLGSEGAIAGLEGSDLTVSDLYELGFHYGVLLDQKLRRTDIINELVNRKFVRIKKTTEELLAMDHGDLRKYFEDMRVSRSELLNLLGQFDIDPGSEAKKNLVEFAAREISDLGMYERVAAGKRGS